MQKIQLDQVSKSLLTLFTPLDFNLAVASILSGNTPGLIYVDDPQQPTVALVRFKDRLYLAGSPAGELLDLELAQILSGEMLIRCQPAFILQVADPAWESHLPAILPNLSPEFCLRQHYICRQLAEPWQPLLPSAYQLRPVDASLLNTPDLAGMDNLRQEMVSERPSVADFLQRSFGVCLLFEGVIVGFCMSEYNLNGRCEVGVWTDESHRQRGLGKLMTLALVEGALQRGDHEVGWHCWADNLPSAALARSSGLVKQRDYPVYLYLLED